MSHRLLPRSLVCSLAAITVSALAEDGLWAPVERGLVARLVAMTPPEVRPAVAFPSQLAQCQLPRNRLARCGAGLKCFNASTNILGKASFPSR